MRARVVYTSTDYVFDGQKESPYVEDDLPHPLNVYGRSKLQGERYVQDLTEDGVTRSDTMALWKTRKQFCRSILGKPGEEGTYDRHDQTGSPTVRLTWQAISTLIQPNCRGVFHVANSGYCTWFTFGRFILDISGLAGVNLRPITSKELKPGSRPPLNSCFNCGKFEAASGITLRPWSEAVKEYLQSTK